jgi:uncharacterized protein (TIGR02246 family)
MLNENTIKGGAKVEFEKIAKENFVQWAESLKIKDPKIMAGFYSEDATFLPTLSSDFKKGMLEAEGYFIHFLEKNPVAALKEDAVQILGDESYLHSGMYNFEVGTGEEKKTVQARFSYVWKKNPNGKWVIIHHHSSLKPE